MIDASHANSQKKHENQLAVADATAQRLEAGDTRIVGVMVESHLVAGRQNLAPGARRETLTYGQSITNACLGWDDSVTLLDRLAAGVRGRRLKATNYKAGASRTKITPAGRRPARDQPRRRAANAGRRPVCCVP
jgi:3-deoxy-7-phosphoheptulonate synthase